MNEPVQGQEAGSGSGGKVLMACGIGCLVLVLAASIGGYLLVQKGKSLALGLGATMVTEFSRMTFEDLALPDDEVQAAMQPVEAFAKQLRAGQVSAEQGVGVLRALTEGHVPALVMARGFEAKQLLPSALSEEEKEEGRKNTSRFAHGVTTEAIPASQREEVVDHVTVVKTQTINGRTQTTRTFKKSISQEELVEVLALMKKAADDAGIPDEMIQLDLAAEIAAAIKSGMANPQASPGAGS